MESALSAAPPESPFDPYRDPFDISSRRDTLSAANDAQESWGSRDNNSNSPLEHHHEMNNRNNSNNNGGDMGTHGIHHQHQSARGDGGSLTAAHEPKKKRFVCPQCTRTFARSGHLQRHERSRIHPLFSAS